jgi:HNH endonuclease
MSTSWYYIHEDGFARIPLSGDLGEGKEAILDATSVSCLMSTTWFLDSGYARADGQKMHRVIMKALVPNPDNLPVVDHINRNKLDNRLSNLRWASYLTNNLNLETVHQLKGTRGAAMYSVSWWEDCNQEEGVLDKEWIVQTLHIKTATFLGRFKTEAAASRRAHAWMNNMQAEFGAQKFSLIRNCKRKIQDSPQVVEKLL